MHRLALAVAASTVGPMWAAGADLIDLLNVPFLDGCSPARDDARHLPITPDAPVGQTFRTGPDTNCVFEIAVWQAFWHESWQADESLVMTLWDGPERRVAYARCAIPYARRMWEQAVPIFHLDARVEPNHPYYFELTVEIEPLRPAEIPREWILSGTRPGHAGGDGRLEGVGVARGDYPDGQAFIAGAGQDCDLWFAVHARRAPDEEALCREAFSRFDLERPDLEQVKEAVRQEDWRGAAEALVAHFEARPDLLSPDRVRPRFDPAFDTREADLAAEHKVLLADGTTVDLGPQWNHFALWPERGGVGLTRSGLRKPLAAGYLHTANEKYAQAFTDMLANQFLEHPSPVRAGVFAADEPIPAALPTGLAGGSFWSGLSIGARMAHGFAYYSSFVDSPCFTRDVRAAFIVNLGEMAEVLERMKGGGNWETQMADALFDFGLTYPEFRGAKRWVDQGLGALVANARSTVRPDGCLQEPTTNYHLLVMGRYVSVIERTRELGLALPDDFAPIAERMHEYVMYSALPDGSLPLWGDSNPPTDTASLRRGAELLGRDDFRFVGTNGEEGQAPSETSRGFPDGGFYYMRSGWDAEAHYLAIRCGPHGSHGHADALSLILSAFGRLVLIDPGVYVYGTPESAELSATRSHNTVTVGEAEAWDASTERWIVSEHFDFLAGRNGGYRELPGVQHARRVLFLKPFGGHPGLWVIRDDVTGEGERSAALRFRFAPMSVSHDLSALTVWTDASPGLQVAVAQAPGITLTVDDGIAAASWEGLARVPVAAFERRGPLPFGFSSVLVPYAAQPPAVHVHALPVAPEAAGVYALWATADEEAVAVLGRPIGPAAGVSSGLSTVLPDGRRLAADGTAVAVRFARVGGLWQPYAVCGADVRSVALDDRTLLPITEPQAVVDRLLR